MMVAVPASLLAGSTVLLGDQTAESVSDSSGAGVAEAFRATATASGSVSAVTLYVDSPNSATTIVVGLYSNLRGSPGKLLSQATVNSFTMDAWNTFPVPAVDVTANTVYWIAVLGRGGTLAFRDGGTNCESSASAQTGLTELPASWVAGKSWPSCRLSAYGTYTVTPSVTPSKASATFSPTSQNVTSNGASGSASFTTTAASKVIFYDDFAEASLSSDWLALDVNAEVNSQVECYVPSQVALSGGYLVITSIAQTTTCGGTTKSYASGAVVWSTFNFTYGTVEYRAKFAGGQGTWPAIWLLGAKCQPSAPTIYNADTCDWPNAGSNEIDITEIKGKDFTSPRQNFESPNKNWLTCQPRVSDVTRNFHVYDLVWTSSSLTWLIDGVQTCQFSGDIQIPTKPMYLIINTAMGGDAGSVNDATLPQTLQVDYVKVTQP
jgi:beta-glucanase (GH16 family)